MYLGGVYGLPATMTQTPPACLRPPTSHEPGTCWQVRPVRAPGRELHRLRRLGVRSSGSCPFRATAGFCAAWGAERMGNARWQSEMR
jgi:hypothetical protein